MKVNKNQGEKSLYVGAGLIKPLIFNPTREELDKVLGIEREEDYTQKPEFEYVKEDHELKRKDKDGNELESIYAKRVTVTCWVQEVKTEEIFPVNFTLYDTPDVSQTGKTKYVTQHGKSTYIDDASNLPEWFTMTPGKKKKEVAYHMAKMGEASLLSFLAALTNISNFDVESSLFPENPKRFWNGDMKELNALIADFPDSTVMAQFGVRTKEVTDEATGNTETKESQAIGTKGFCQGGFMKYFKSYASKNFEGIMNEITKENPFTSFDTKAKIGDVSMYNLGTYLNNNFGEFGMKEYTVMEEIREYTSEENPVNSEGSMIGTSSSSDYD